MESIKEININCTYCFLNDKINIRNFNSNLLKTDTKVSKNTQKSGMELKVWFKKWTIN